MYDVYHIFQHYFIYIAAISAPICVLLKFYLPVLRTISFPGHCLLSYTIIEKIDSGEKGMNPVALIIVNSRREYWPSLESKKRPPVLKSCSL